jgi:hypothetical protein
LGLPAVVILPAAAYPFFSLPCAGYGRAPVRKEIPRARGFSGSLLSPCGSLTPIADKGVFPETVVEAKAVLLRIM